MHSIIGGSKAPVFAHCDAFVIMTSGMPERESTQDQRDGTAAHEIGAKLILAAAVAQRLTWADFEGKTATDGTLFTEEMFDAAKLYADDVAAVMRSRAIFGGPNLLVEELMPAPRIHPAAFCTSDAAIYRSGKLTLWEFKFGHRYVDEFENWQAVYNFAALLDRFKIDGYGDQLLELEFRIVQPRVYGHGGPIRVWSLKASDLRPLVNQLEARAAAQFGPNPVATTGPHCCDCDARTRCPAAIQAGVGLYEVAVRALPKDPTPTDLGLQALIIQEAIDRLTAIQKGFDETILALTRGGTPVPGWAWESKTGRATWNCSTEDVIAVGNALGVNIAKPGVMTPNQAKDAGLDAATVDALTIRPARGFRVVPAKGANIKRIFSNG